MTRDLVPTTYAIRRAIEEYGSLAHLAEALNVSAQQLRAWRDGTEPMPLDLYHAMIDVVAARKRGR
jgi:hypothetical protein